MGISNIFGDRDDYSKINIEIGCKTFYQKKAFVSNFLKMYSVRDSDDSEWSLTYFLEQLVLKYEVSVKLFGEDRLLRKSIFGHAELSETRNRNQTFSGTFLGTIGTKSFCRKNEFSVLVSATIRSALS